MFTSYDEKNIFVEMLKVKVNQFFNILYYFPFSAADANSNDDAVVDATNTTVIFDNIFVIVTCYCSTAI